MGQAKQRSNAVKQCIYCSDVNNLTDEHVLPYGLGGDLVLKKASCQNCAKVTSQLEQRLLRGHWWPYRRYLGMKSRRPSEQDANLPVLLKREFTEDRKAELPINEQSIALVFELDPPSIFRGEYRSDAPAAPRVFMKQLGPPPKAVLIDGNSHQLLPDEKLEIPVNFDAGDLCRFLAKVAHGYAIHRRGLSAFEEFFLPEIILGKTQGALTFVGGNSSPFIGPRLFGSGINSLSDRVNGEFLTVYIQLFRDSGAPPPIYEIVVGRLR